MSAADLKIMGLLPIRTRVWPQCLLLQQLYLRLWRDTPNSRAFVLLLVLVMLTEHSLPVTFAVPLPSPPPSSAASCGDNIQLYSKGVPVNDIWLAFYDAKTGSVMDNSSALLMEVGKLPFPITVGTTVNGTANAVIRQGAFGFAVPSVGVLSEADFKARYNGAAGCTEPDFLLPIPAPIPLNTVAATELNYGGLLQSILSTSEPCKPLPLYGFARFSDAGQPIWDPHYAWLANKWVSANDASNPICRDSPTSWGYVELEIYTCPCQPPPPPVPLPSPPPSSAASCGDNIQLYSKGVPVNDIWLAFYDAKTGSVMDNSSALLMEVGKLPFPITVGTTVNGTANAVIRQGAFGFAVPSVGVLSEADFKARYNGAAGCTEPDFLLPIPAPIPLNTVAATELNYGGLLQSILSTSEPCKPLPLYGFARFSDAGQPIWDPHYAWLANKWVSANDASNPICRDSPTSWGYVELEIYTCPCQPPPPASPPPPPSPPRPPSPPPPPSPRPPSPRPPSPSPPSPPPPSPPPPRPPLPPPPPPPPPPRVVLQSPPAAAGTPSPLPSQVPAAPPSSSGSSSPPPPPVTTPSSSAPSASPVPVSSPPSPITAPTAQQTPPSPGPPPPPSASPPKSPSPPLPPSPPPP
ncbi:hypothetical protein Vretimale_11140, partial [Volvox reticuliferus]